jgi:hypothetical protein
MSLSTKLYRYQFVSVLFFYIPVKYCFDGTFSPCANLLERRIGGWLRII